MSEHEPIVSVKNLRRRFGDVCAVDDISFDISPGQVLGFIGANGAGKTTTMRIMATLDAPDSGSISICGHDVIQFPKTVRGRLGWMPDSYGRYSLTTVTEYLDFYARAFGYSPKERKVRIDEVMGFTDLVSLSDRYIDELSKGMSQRLCLGRMLLHDPQVLVMDEPAAGLDPKARVEFKHLVRLLAEDSKAVFISSHILSELEDMCDSILFIDQGRIVHHGETEQLKDRGDIGVVVEIRVASDDDALKDWISVNPGIEFVESIRGGCRARLESRDTDDVAEVLRRMVRHGITVIDFHRQQKRLEEVFIDILQEVEGSEEGRGK